MTTTSGLRRELVHSRTVAADPDTVYRIVADVERWPVVFGPCVHVDLLARTATSERFRLWAQVNGAVAGWTSRRELDQGGLRIAFAQEVSTAPVTGMGGEWIFVPRSRGRTEIVLTHWFTVAGGTAELDAITAAVDANSEQELAAIGRLVDQGVAVDELLFTFSDTVPLDGPAADAYRFVAESDRWPQQLPHVGRVALLETQCGEALVQDMEMDTVTGDGSAHTTRSIRLCFPTGRIVYKQLLPPAILSGHSGSWRFVDDAGPARAVATHTVAIDTTRIAELLGPDVTTAGARAHLRKVLGANSRATLAAATSTARAA